jgi:hypothetical protein
MLERALRRQSIDQELLKFYNNLENDSLSEFHEDCQAIIDLRKELRKWINKRRVTYLSIRNKYILLRNVFSILGLIHIGINYFAEDEKLFECFCSLLWHFDRIRLDNWLSDNFIKYLQQNDL